MTGHALATAAGGPVIPNFGGPKAFACERANRLFCWDWFSQNWDSVLWPALRQHVVLTVIAVAIGFAIATALALLAYRHRWVEQPVVIVTTIFYTIPALALFELLVPVPGLGLSRTTAEVALVVLHAADPLPQHAHGLARGAGRGARRGRGDGDDPAPDAVAGRVAAGSAGDHRRPADRDGEHDRAGDDRCADRSTRGSAFRSSPRSATPISRPS